MAVLFFGKSTGAHRRQGPLFRVAREPVHRVLWRDACAVIVARRLCCQACVVSERFVTGRLRMDKHMRMLWFWRLAFVISMVVVGYGSLVPGDTLPPIASNDKLLHLLGHGGIAFCAALAFPTRWRVLLVLLPLYGAGLEVLQRWVPNRSFDWQDMVANVSGVLLAFALVWVWRRYRRR